MTASERLTRLQGLGLFKLFLDCLDDDFWVFFFGTGALRLLVFLSNILDENKVNLEVSMDETHVIVDVARSISKVTTRKKCNVSVACLLLRQP